MSEIVVRSLSLEEFDHHLERLAEILRACVHDGASVSFILPFAVEDARAFWREKVRPGFAAGDRDVLIASVDGVAAGVVQVVYDTPPNQAHRAEIAKMLTHPDFRRRGVARCLMLAAESAARAAGRSLITLDTRTGDAAEQLYGGLGYARAGVIPGFALAPEGGRFDGTTYMYKAIGDA